jgi:hypothetical protein
MDRRRFDRRVGKSDRRWCFPGMIENRGKASLPFTTREPDFVPDGSTQRRKDDAKKKTKTKST